MTFEIEKNIPFFEEYYTKYPFAQMEVGDSFLFKSEKCLNVRAKLDTASSAFGKRNCKKFSVRYVGDGYRVWRIA